MGELPFEVTRTRLIRSSQIAQHYFDAAKPDHWIFPIVAGTIIQRFGGVPHAPASLGAIYLLGLIVPWFVPETVGKALPT